MGRHVCRACPCPADHLQGARHAASPMPPAPTRPLRPRAAARANPIAARAAARATARGRPCRPPHACLQGNVRRRQSGVVVEGAVPACPCAHHRWKLEGPTAGRGERLEGDLGSGCARPFVRSSHRMAAGETQVKHALLCARACVRVRACRRTRLHRRVQAPKYKAYIQGRWFWFGPFGQLPVLKPSIYFAQARPSRSTTIHGVREK
jgi:hypothetical protein